MRRLDILPGSDWLRRGPIALATLAAFAVANPVHANNYYAGKTITLMVGTDTGGGFSIYARVIAKHLTRYIPGNPTIVIRNMPGAGGAVASTWLYQIASRDGTVIGSVSPNAILPAPSATRACA
jgi:tripartite-type tricarboxylate transporter receptor subunit TctC